MDVCTHIFWLAKSFQQSVCSRYQVRDPHSRVCLVVIIWVAVPHGNQADKHRVPDVEFFGCKVGRVIKRLVDNVLVDHDASVMPQCGVVCFSSGLDPILVFSGLSVNEES